MCSNFSTFSSILFSVFQISHPNRCEVVVSLFFLLLPFFFFFAEPGVMWDLSSLTRDPTLPLAVEAWSLNHGTVIFLVLTVLLSGKDSWFVIPVCVGLPQNTAPCFLLG